MTTQNYLMIQENVVINLCVWDGDVNTWQPPQEATMLIQTTTPTKIWGLNQDKNDYILIDSVGDGDIGFTWDGTYCITNQPKPELPIVANDQPITNGTVTI